MSHKQRMKFPEGRDAPSKVWSPRRKGGCSIGALIPALTQSAFRKQSPFLIRLKMDWEKLLGSRLGRETEPRRVTGGTLTLACSGPVAMEIQYEAPQILERLNTAFGLRGERAFTRLKIVQDRTLVERPASPVRRKPLEVSVPDIEDDALRSALQRLGGYVSQSQGSRPSVSRLSGSRSSGGAAQSPTKEEDG